MMKFLIKISEEFEVLSSRQAGASARVRFLSLLKSSENFLVIDFECHNISPSFADESIGLLAQQLGMKEFKERVKIINASAQTKAILKHVITSRVSTKAKENSFA
ncbi:STAS-like domain-containing protein [Alteromonas gilva]|uniref:DUF4325 domain-containing protein n=1 Tax=Alteromonas gilva TaxID=2987522 RepID=A0ABT5L5A0_9ALTE|nr:DUF4325 domain-containing protein [Alteromonas gilva]MDC8832230.1 DUF4325 domain-containing protein [Alteromonas gilva]